MYILSILKRNVDLPLGIAYKREQGRTYAHYYLFLMKWLTFKNSTFSRPSFPFKWLRVGSERVKRELLHVSCTKKEIVNPKERDKIK